MNTEIWARLAAVCAASALLMSGLVGVEAYRLGYHTGAFDKEVERASLPVPSFACPPPTVIHPPQVCVQGHCYDIEPETKEGET